MQEKKIDKITESVRADLLRRSELGIKKYGSTLCEDNISDFLNHAYEECLDMAQYLKKEIVTRQQLENILTFSANDHEIATRLRAFLRTTGEGVR